MGKARLSWFLLVSITAHIICLWQWNLAYLYRHSLLRPFKIDLLGSASLHEGTDASEITVPSLEPSSTKLPRTAAHDTRATPGKAASSGSETSASSESNSMQGSNSLGGIVSSPAGGNVLGGEGGSSGPAGRSSGGGLAAPGGATGLAPAGAPAVAAGAKRSPSATQTPPIDSILPTLRHPIHGDVYFDVDSYVLEGVRVSALNLCIDADQLRTNDPITLTDSVTDRSLCHIRTRNDKEMEICPAAATKTVVRFAGHLRTPLSYSLNVCLVYDRSNCRIFRAGTDNEREVCRPVRYDGVWAAGTNFDYRCQTSEVRTYHHPVEFTVRHLVDMERSDGTYQPKEVRRVRYPIPQCQ